MSLTDFSAFVAYDMTETTAMNGVVTFPTLTDALRAGYTIYDRTAEGYLVRTRTARGWALALVTIKR